MKLRNYFSKSNSDVVMVIYFFSPLCVPPNWFVETGWWIHWSFLLLYVLEFSVMQLKCKHTHTHIHMDPFLSLIIFHPY